MVGEGGREGGRTDLVPGVPETHSSVVAIGSKLSLTGWIPT